MTSIIGILCEDGVVIGADSSATFGASDGKHELRTIEQPTKKIEVISDSIIVAGAGEIGLGQRVCDDVKKLWDDKAFKGTEIDTCRTICKTCIEDFAFTGAPKGAYGALIAFPVNHKPCLCEFALKDFQPELKNKKIWYGSMGSAQYITDPFLGFIREVFWNERIPNINEGIFSVYWTLHQAIELNTGGVKGPIQIAVLEKETKAGHIARELEEEELFEHQQHINEVVGLLRGFQENMRNPQNAQEVPKL